MIPRPPRRLPRRDPVGIHRPLPVAPDTVAEVLALAAPDVSRETPPEPEPEPEPYPALRKDQIARLEALTAVWERQVRLEGPADATLLYSAPKPPPPPPRVRVVELVPPVVTEDTPRTPDPAPAPAPGVDPTPDPVRVSDWSSRHDPASLEYGVRERLGRLVPLADVSLETGVVLDQGTTPPLSVHDASACVGMAGIVAANVLFLGPLRGDTRAGWGLRDEDDARRLYALAQKRDQIHGEDYAGTSVLGGMKAGRDLGLWDGFLWALRGTRDIAQVLLQLRLAVVLGLPWSANLENPDRDGVIVPGGASMGGHSLAAVGLRLVLAGRPGPWFELQQSRGPAEGHNGRVFIHHRHLAQLLAGIGEAAVPFTAGVLS